MKVGGWFSRGRTEIGSTIPALRPSASTTSNEIEAGPK